MANQYFNPSAKNLTATWHLIDAKEMRLGKVATKAASILMGKHEPNYVPHLDNGDRVVIINASHLSIDERKASQKHYYRHSGYPGGIKSQTLAELNDVRPTEVIRKAVKGMLPKTRMGATYLNKLYIYPEEAHEQQAQQPKLVKF